jgi:hypothetical protein
LIADELCHIETGIWAGSTFREILNWVRGTNGALRILTTTPDAAGHLHYNSHSYIAQHFLWRNDRVADQPSVDPTPAFVFTNQTSETMSQNHHFSIRINSVILELWKY